MHIHKKSAAIILWASALLFMTAAVLPSCSKDDTATDISHYALEGTWQLYKTTTGPYDSIYTPGADNQLVFTPDFYRMYNDGVLRDSGSYTIAGLEQNDGFTGTWMPQSGLPAGIYIHGDTLETTPGGFILNMMTYIKTDTATGSN